MSQSILLSWDFHPDLGSHHDDGDDDDDGNDDGHGDNIGNLDLWAFGRGRP